MIPGPRRPRTAQSREVPSDARRRLFGTTTYAFPRIDSDAMNTTTPDETLNNPQFLPFKLDPIAKRVLFVRLDARQRLDAAFLDERALTAQAEGAWLPLERLPEQVPSSSPCHFIFHIGHCGSTLLSRLLGTWPQVQVLREPLPLRILAAEWPEIDRCTGRFSPLEWQRTMRQTIMLLARPLGQATETLIKATSNCNGLIAPALALFPRTRVLLLDMALRPYLATLLKSPASVNDAAVAAPERLRYLREQLGEDPDLVLHRLSLPQQCALGWLAERHRFRALLQADASERILHVDFDDLLRFPQNALQTIARHLGWNEDAVADAMSSPAWGRYSKAQEHGYAAADRGHDIAYSLKLHAEEIASGEAFVQRLCQRHQQLHGLSH